MTDENRMSKYIKLGNFAFGEVETVYEEDGDLCGFKTSVIGANVLGVKAMTNGYHGGDGGHGCHSYIELEDYGGTEMMVSTESDDPETKVRIDLFGDSELSTLIAALRFMADALETSAEYAESKKNF